MNKIHEKHTIQKHSITFLIPKQSSRWFQLNTDKKYTKFIQNSINIASEREYNNSQRYCAIPW
jgi:hypothetical protein